MKIQLTIGLLLLCPLATTDAQCTWQSQDLLTPEGGYGGKPQYFARSLAPSGSELLIGSPGLDGALGEAELLHFDGSSWVLADTLWSAYSVGEDDFGRSTALFDDFAAVGAPGAGDESGAVSVFERTDGVWAEVARFAPTTTHEAEFGLALGLHGTTLLVGAPGIDTVFVYERTDGVWTPAGSITVAEEGEELGVSIDFNGDLAVIGAMKSEEAYIYSYDGTSWTQTDLLVGVEGAEEADFGAAVALDGDTIAVGAEGDDGSGAVYVFAQIGGVWTQQAMFPSPSGAAEGEFGSSVALEDNTLVVGAPGDEAGLGSVYVYQRAYGAWFPSAEVAPYLEEGEGQFGSVVSLSDGLLIANIGLDETGLIGAVGPYAGAAQVFASPFAGCDPLLASTPALSASSGGRQDLLLDVGMEGAGDFYLLLGSSSGFTPGIAGGSDHHPAERRRLLRVDPHPCEHGHSAEHLRVPGLRGSSRLLRFPAAGGRGRLGRNRAASRVRRHQLRTRKPRGIRQQSGRPPGESLVAARGRSSPLRNGNHLMRTRLGLLLAAAVLFTLVGCNTVEFYEKEAMTNRLMVFEADGTEAHFHQKVFYSIEGAAGGIGESAGGGCGCY